MKRHMKKCVFGVVTLMILVFAVVQLPAHEKFRVVGTITKFAKSRLEVKNQLNKIIKIEVDKFTIVRRDKDKVDVKELKAGRSVVVDALGDTEKDLVAVEIRLVPAITTSSGK